MNKEKITLEVIKQDMYRLIKWQLAIASEWRLPYVVPITLLSVLLCLIPYSFWIGILVFSVAAYHIVRYWIAVKGFFSQKRAIRDVVTRDDIHVFVEKFSHSATKNIHEPHLGPGTESGRKDIWIFCFHSLLSWRDPIFTDLYDWSEEHTIDSRALRYMSHDGDEYFYVSLKEYPDVAYIYPCKFFDLDCSLKRDCSE